MAESKIDDIVGFAQKHASAVCLGFALLLGLGDYATGIELTFTLLYLVPITLATWWNGRVLGNLIAVLCTGCAVITEVDAQLGHGETLPFFRLVWSHGGALAIFLFVVFLVARLREHREQETRAHQSTVAQLRQAERLGVVGRLAAGVAHELGTPINVIAGYAEMLDTESVAPPMIRTASTAILAQTTRMTKIIRGLLDFSRRSSHERQPVDLLLISTEAAAVLHSIAQKHNVVIEVVSERPERISAIGNQTELEQVILNLILNGIQAMPQGGKLRVSIRQKQNTPSRVRATSDWVCVSVEDQGVGVPDDVLDQIFDPFFTTKEIGDGTGLGLSVSYGIVSDHGGRIEVDSKVGAGSTFTVYLPCAQ